MPRHRRRAEPNPGTFSGRLRLARVHTGLSQGEAAEKFGVSHRSVSQWELGETRPAEERLQAIAELYKISLEWLQGDNPLAIEAPPGTSGRALAAAIKEIQPAREVFISHSGDVPFNLAERNRPDVVVLKELHIRDWTLETADLRQIPPIQEWAIPRDQLRKLKNLDDVRLVEMGRDVITKPETNSKILKGDVLIVDCSVAQPQGTHGIYFINDHAACLIRRIEAFHNREKNRVEWRLSNDISDNRIVDPDDVRVLGSSLESPGVDSTDGYTSKKIHTAFP
jgi:transcriptional regulator with XRE-family HTH domain